MIAIVHSIYSQSVHALALNAGSMDNDAGRYCMYFNFHPNRVGNQSKLCTQIYLQKRKLHKFATTNSNF